MCDTTKANPVLTDPLFFSLANARDRAIEAAITMHLLTEAKGGMLTCYWRDQVFYLVKTTLAENLFDAFERADAVIREICGMELEVRLPKTDVTLQIMKEWRRRVIEAATQ